MAEKGHVPTGREDVLGLEHHRVPGSADKGEGAHDRFRTLSRPWHDGVQHWHDEDLHRTRHMVENSFNRLKCRSAWKFDPLRG